MATSLRAIELAEEKRAHPQHHYVNMGFDLHKSAFRDAITLRYGWTPADLPTAYVCVSHFSVESPALGGLSQSMK